MSDPRRDHPAYASRMDDPTEVEAYVCTICMRMYPGGIAAGIEHLKHRHPEEYDTVLKWPDGTPVVVDETLQPEDFR